MTGDAFDVALDDRLRNELRAVEVGGPPLGVVHQRVLRIAEDRRRRRLVRWVAGAVALIAIPAGATTVNLLPAGRSAGSRLEASQPTQAVAPDVDGVESPPVPGADATPTTAARSGELSAATRRPEAAAPAAATSASPGSAAHDGGQSGSTSYAAPAQTPTADDPTAASGGEDAPTTEGCDVQGYDDKSVYVPGGGAGAGSPPSCSYVASRAGGYVGTGNWILEIERNGYVRTLRAESSPRCGAVGIVQPGDRVKATVRGGVESATEPGSLRVGPDQGC